MTSTRSPFLIFAPIGLDHLRCERDDLHELLVAKFTADRPEDTGAAGLPVCLENDGCVLVEADVRAICSTSRLACPNDDSFDDVALLHVAAGDRVLHGCDDRVAETCVATLRAPEYTNREQLLGTGVIGDLESGFLLNHLLLLQSVSRGLLRLLEDLDQTPALRGAERAGLVDEHEITDAGRVLLVVGLHLRRTAHDLAVQRVLHAVFDLDNDGLVHLVADHVAAASLTVAALFLLDLSHH